MVPTATPSDLYYTTNHTSFDSSQEPSSYPVNMFPTSEPEENWSTTQYSSTSSTESPVTTSSQVSEKVDIEITSLESLSSNVYGLFNPGFRHEMLSKIVVKIESSELVTEFENWYYNGNNGSSTNTGERRRLDSDAKSTVSIEWAVYNDKWDEISFNASNILAYSESEFVKINETFATYKIDAYFVLNSSQSVSEYSINSICDTYSTDYFASGEEYTFEINVNVNINDNIDKNSFDLTLTSNTPPVNGSCMVSPLTGTSLIDRFNFSCHGWSSATTDELSYNFIYGNVLLKSSYDEMSWITTYLSSGNQTVTGVIVDDLSLATCVDIDVQVDAYDGVGFTLSDNEITTEDIENVSSILIELLVDKLSDGNTTEASIIVSIVWDIFTDYVDDINFKLGSTSPNTTLSSEAVSALADFQSELITSYVDVIGGGITTVAESVTALNVLAVVTVPIVNLVEVDNKNDDNYYYYNASLIRTILDVMSDDIIGVFEDGNVLLDIGNLDFDIAKTTFDTFSNVVVIRSLSDESNDTAIENGQTMIDTTETVTQLLLGFAIPGETYLIETESLIVEATKISPSVYDICGVNSFNSLQLSQEFVNAKLIDVKNSTDFLDCTIMITHDNLYFSSSQNSIIDFEQFDNNTFIGDFVLVDVTAEIAGAHLAAISLSTGGATVINNETVWVDKCSPITIILNKTVDESFWDISDSHFPTCAYFNGTTLTFETTGCYVSYSDNSITECSCQHSTYFGTRWEDFTPEINYYGESKFQSISGKNLILYPLGWIVVGCWVSVCVLLIVIFRIVTKRDNKKQMEPKNRITQVIASILDIRDKPLIMEIDKHVTFSEKLKFRSIQELRVIKDDNLKDRSLFVKWFHLFLISLKCDHIWLGICCRSWGTSYTYTQRIAILMIRLLTSLAVGALFYGRAKATVIGDISLSLVFVCSFVLI